MTFSVNVLAPSDLLNRTPGELKQEATVDEGDTTRIQPSSDASFETATMPPSEPIKQSLENVLEQDAVPARDPIRWFGILVPSALRSAQSYFVSALEGPVPEMASLSKDLRQQEIEIGRLRKQLKKL